MQLPAPQFPLVYASCIRFIALYWDCYLFGWFWSLLLGAQRAEDCTLAAAFPSTAVNCIRSEELMGSDQAWFMVSRFSRGASGWAL